MTFGSRFTVAYGATLLALAIVAAAMGFKEIRFDGTSIEQVFTLLLSLALVALVIERAVEVYVAKRYDPEKLRVRRPLARAEAKLAKAERELSDERERRHGSTRAETGPEEELMKELIENARKAQEELNAADERVWLPLSKVRASKIRMASALSLVFGAFASLSGVRVLGQLASMESEQALINGITESAFQLGAFRVTDTVLTALVLAGGADGIHKMISSLKSFRSSA